MSQLQSAPLLDVRTVGPATLHVGDVLDVLPLLTDESVHSIVTDTPYELPTGKGALVDEHMGPTTQIARSVEFWSECLRVLKPGGHVLAMSASRTYHRMACAIEDAGFEIRDQIMWVYGSGFPKSLDVGRHAARIDPAADWDGWGTGLKPAAEPICLARKPFPGSVAECLLRHGTGALHIDPCRVPADSGDPGRWPANLVHDGSPEVRAAFPDAPGQLARASLPGGTRSGQNVYGTLGRGSNGSAPRQDADRSAARFFYCAKASPSDRGPGNDHPTVKPTVLMQYLARLITPPGGVVLDPFMGSGSTGKACVLEGFYFIGIDIRPNYVDTSYSRIEREVLRQK